MVKLKMPITETDKTEPTNTYGNKAAMEKMMKWCDTLWLKIYCP